MPKEITIPFNFEPRSYQVPLLSAIDSGVKRAVSIWHRRSGKDKTLINLVAKKMFERVGTYYYFFPTYSQGKKILWDGMDRMGMKFTDHIPSAVRKRTNDQEMKIEIVNGSMFQVIGTDNIDSIVGTNPIGCIFSEYSLQNPKAWDFVRPILSGMNCMKWQRVIHRGFVRY
jgi:phage terminase large subunit